MTANDRESTQPNWLEPLRSHADALLEQHERLAALLRERSTPPIDAFEEVFARIRQLNEALAEAESSRLSWLDGMAESDTEAALRARAGAASLEHWRSLVETAKLFRSLSEQNLMALRRIDHFLGERINFLTQREEPAGSLYSASGNAHETDNRGRSLGDA